MKNFITHIIVLALIFSIGVITDSAYAAKGGGGNNFPEGEHYNLNLIAKKSDPGESGYFKCPDPLDYQHDWYLATGCDINDLENCTKCDTPDVGDCTIQVDASQNVIFVPRDNDVDGGGVPDMDISILIMSGSDSPGKGNKNKDKTPPFAVTDWCTAHFPNNGEMPSNDNPGDGATFRLPENSKGYLVYARVTGKPVVDEVNTKWTFTSPAYPFETFQDEYGNDLIYMGTIGGPEADCTDSAGNVVLERVNTGKGQGKGKGVNQATDITCLFEFTGDVCYFNDVCYYCEDPPESGPENYVCYDFGDFPDAEGPLPNLGPHVCCDKIDLAVLDYCGRPVRSGCELLPLLDTECDPYAQQCEFGECDLETQDEIIPECRQYDETWVFNMADFVDVMWNSIGNGAYVIQVRFYPQ
jgi:hypothetical protein